MSGHDADAERGDADQTGAASGAAVPAHVTELPAAVRARVVALVAGVLPEVKALPAALRSVAGFTPARRARVGERAIVAALDAPDDDFRSSAGRLVRTVAGTDPVDRAAVSWLTGADDAASALAAVGPARPADDELVKATERLRGKLAEAEQRIRSEREQHHEAVAGLKAENTDLRRKLGSSRADHRAAQERIEELTAEIDRLTAAAAASQGESRRLREQLQDAQEALQSGRAGRRAERDELNLRTRLLLDALVDTASGLRRELALPAVPGSPADRIEAELAAGSEEGGRLSSVTGSLGAASPALLDQLLALPRARLIVDGYNVSMAGWSELPLERQRQRLLAGLSALVARTGAETTVVFDAHGSAARPVVSAPRGVRVIFTPSGVIADDVIRDLVAAEPAGRQLVVVTSDQEVVRDVRRAGARTVPADALVALVARAS